MDAQLQTVLDAYHARIAEESASGWAPVVVVPALAAPVRSKWR